MLKIHLGQLQPGEVATIAFIEAEEGLRQRLHALGFRVTRPVKMIRRAWCNGPLHVRIGSTEVMLRTRDAQEIHIKDICTGVS
jgi:ferrous iron transport protein A